jgi:glutamine cyclotransferase
MKAHVMSLPLAIVILFMPAALACQNGASDGASADTVRFELVQQLPHDPTAYTQGLLYDGGQFLESTGVRGQSTLRRVALETGQVLTRIDVPEDRFAEGIAVFGDRVFQLTWTSGIGYIYDRETLALRDSFEYSGEGWGLTSNGTSLIMSDGSATLRFLDPQSLDVTRTLTVRSNGAPLSAINELEYIGGEIWANVYQSNYVVRIDVESGNVVRWIDASALVPPDKRGSADEVLNGIAYDPEGDRIFITGKRWPAIYHVRVAEHPTGS